MQRIDRRANRLLHGQNHHAGGERQHQKSDREHCQHRTAHKSGRVNQSPHQNENQQLLHHNAGTGA